MLDKFGVARALREIGALLELEGENPFKVRAYENGARAVEALAEDLGALVAANRLLEVKGIGDALARKIADLHGTGTTELLDRLRAKPPARHARAAARPRPRAEEGGGAPGRARHPRAGGPRAGLPRRPGARGEGVRRADRGADPRRRPAAPRARRGPAVPARRGPRRGGADPRGPARLPGGAPRRARRLGAPDAGDGRATSTSSPRRAIPARCSDRLAAYPLVAETVARGDTKTTVRLASGLPGGARRGAAPRTSRRPCTTSPARRRTTRSSAGSRGSAATRSGSAGCTASRPEATRRRIRR